MYIEQRIVFEADNPPDGEDTPKFVISVTDAGTVRVEDSGGHVFSVTDGDWDKTEAAINALRRPAVPTNPGA
jgi:hypothetical protein